MITLLSTSDTDLLSAQAATHVEDVHYQYANPNLLTEQTLAQLVDTTDVFVVRLLGGKRAWEWGLDALLASKNPWWWCPASWRSMRNSPTCQRCRPVWSPPPTRI